MDLSEHSLKPLPQLSQVDVPFHRVMNGNANMLDLSCKTVRKITCLGSGFVGGPISAVTAYKTDTEVTVVDINSDRIAAWQSESLPMYEPGLHEIVRAARDGNDLVHDSSLDSSRAAHGKGGFINGAKSNVDCIRQPNLFFSTDIDRAIDDADLIFVCVNTPTKRNGIGKGTAVDLGFVETATRNIARAARGSKIVVEKSTVPCRTAHSIREILSANAWPGVHFDVLSNPEFLAEGTAIKDLLYPDRIIIGSMPTPAGFRAAASLANVYAQWVPKDRIVMMNLWSSELSKLAANAMLAQRISSVNALSAICEVTGADVDEVSHACGLDSRIGPHMLKAGPGFGGSCFQKDIFNIVYLSEALHLSEVADFWRSIITMNEYQKQRFSKRIISCLFDNITDKKIAVLGFAFKKGTSDTRGSPAITLVNNLIAERAKVTVYDPKVKKQQILNELIDDSGSLESLEKNVEVCDSAYQACVGADAVVVVTEWDEFSNKVETTSPIPPASQTVLSEINHNIPQRSRPPAENGKLETPSPCNPLPSPDKPNLSPNPFAPIVETPLQSVIGSMLEPPIPLDWARIAQGMRKPRFVFDGRNILDARKLEELGFHVEAIGRASTNRPQSA